VIDTTLTGHLQVQEGVGIPKHQSYDLALESDSLALVVDLSDRVMREHGDRGCQDGDGDQQQAATGDDHCPLLKPL
jgi:hypothetical protein